MASAAASAARFRLEHDSVPWLQCGCLSSASGSGTVKAAPWTEATAKSVTMMTRLAHFMLMNFGGLELMYACGKMLK